MLQLHVKCVTGYLQILTGTGLHVGHEAFPDAQTPNVEVSFALMLLLYTNNKYTVCHTASTSRKDNMSV